MFRHEFPALITRYGTHTDLSIAHKALPPKEIYSVNPGATPRIPRN
jgi:hypothetical protein